MRKALFKPILAIIIFIAVQVLSAIPNVVGFNLSLPQLLFLSGIVTIFLLYCFKFFEFKQCFSTKDINRRITILAFAGSFSGIVSLNLLSELLNLPDLMEDHFLSIVKSPIGILSIAVLGPICEELVFRESIIRPMLQKGFKPWGVLLGSSLAFGIIHGNPAQIPFAIAMGLIFAIIYWKTNSIFLPTIIHIINNSLSVLMMIYMGTKYSDFHIYDIISKTGNVVLIIIFMTACIILIKHLLQTETKR